MVAEPILGRDFTDGLALPRARPATALQNDPHFLDLAGRLLTLATEEEVSARAARSGALLHRVLVSGDEGTEQWRLYLQRVESTLSSGAVSSREFSVLLEQAPVSRSRAFQEMLSVFHEPDRATFASLTLNLAERNLDRGEFPRLTQALLAVASEHSSTRGRAESLLNLMGGGGGFFRQLDFQGPRLLEDLTSPVALGSFTLAGLGARLTAFSILGRTGRYTLPTLLASEGAAWLVEVPTLVMARRLGAQLFYDGNALGGPREIGEEILSLAGPFLLLRGASNAFDLAAPALSRPFLTAGEVSPLGQVAMGGARLTSELGAMMAGNYLNAAWGIGPPKLSPLDNFYQSLLTVGHMHLSGHIIRRGGGELFSDTFAAERARLLEGVTRSFEGRGGPMNPFGEFFGGLEPAWALSGGRARDPFARPFVVKNELFMVGSGSDGSGDSGSSPPSGGGPPSNPPTRLAVVRELLRASLDEYTSDYESKQTRLGQAATRLKDLLDRYSERPDLAKDEAFARALLDVRTELAEAQKVDNTLKRSWRKLGALLRDYSEETPVAADSKAALDEAANLEKDQAQMEQEARELSRLQKVLTAIRRFGPSEGLQDRLKNAATRLNKIYHGALQWNWPGMRRGGGGPQHQESLEGTLLGLAARGNGTESSLVMELRGEKGRSGVQLDPELEYLQRAMLLAVQHDLKADGLEEEVLGLANSFNVSPKSEAAMVLAAEFLTRFSQDKPAPADLLTGLKDHPFASPLRDELRDLRSLLDDDIPVADGLSMLSQEANSSDYLISGLFLMLRSGGSAERLSSDLRDAGATGALGFHPSISLSLFGAANGREALPAEFLPPQEQIDRFFANVLPKDPGSK